MLVAPALKNSQLTCGESHVSWTRDPFDRLIVAQARCTRRSIALITKDRLIRRHFKGAVW
jgi:PIN domain nuclease of toxin-antitoxin system